MIFNTEEEFEKIAHANGWAFVYGRKDHQNLLKGALKEVEVMFDRNRDIETILYCREFATDLRENVKVEIILGKFSKFKDGYHELNSTHIHPCKQLVLTNIIEPMEGSHNITNVHCTDTINEFDVNVSGAFASFNIRYFDYEC